MSHTDKADIIEFYIRSGKTQREICELLGITPTTVTNRLQKVHGSIGMLEIRKKLTGERHSESSRTRRSIISRKMKPRISKTICKDILESLIAEDLCLKDICTLLQVTDPTLNKFIRANYNCTFKYLRERITGEKVTRATIEKLKNNIHYIFKNSDAITLPGRLYLLRIFNNEEEFYKIGITRSTVDERYGSSALKHFYKYVVEEEIVGSLLEMYQAEQVLMKAYSNYSYIPKNKFDGRTECFSIYVPLKLKEVII